MERPIQFSSGDAKLSGILHLPDDGPARPRFGLVFVHSGSRGRRGNTFQYTLYARHFCKLGYPSLRFDPAGFGDSTGTIERSNVYDFYGTIQTGRFVDDTIRAVEELSKHAQCENLILYGLCGGAITALLAAPQLPQVSGLVLMSVPVIIDSSIQDKVERISKDYARHYLVSLYAKKLLSPRAWLRLIAGRSETGTIWTMIRATFKGTDKKTNLRKETAEGTSTTKFNRQFLDCFNEIVERDARVIFLFGDDDNFRWEFEREFHRPYWDKNTKYSRQSEIHYLPGCNHMFTLREWQQQTIDKVTSWMAKFD
jgi:pimeloyl-ACP methyl ester carboxylesterase